MHNRKNPNRRDFLRMSTAAYGMVFALAPQLRATENNGFIKTDSLELKYDESGELYSLLDRHTGKNWIESAAKCYELRSLSSQDLSWLESELKFEARSDGSIALHLKLSNRSDRAVDVEPTFPKLPNFGLSQVPAQEVFHLFPRQGEMATNVPAFEYNSVYSGDFPMQFIDFYQAGRGGVALMTEDLSNSPKRYYLRRDGSMFDCRVVHRARRLAPGESWNLPAAVLYAHAGDWHAPFFRYRKWLNQNLKPRAPRKQWFRDIYNFRQVFLHSWAGANGAWDPKTKEIDLLAQLRAAEAAFGGADYIHVFDFGQTPEHGRVGDYDPWKYLGGSEALRKQIEELAQRGIRTGLYHEGYLISKESKVGQAHGEEWEMLNREGHPHSRFGAGYYYPCPGIAEWREYLAKAAKRTADTVGAQGVYIDQFGFGWQYGCSNPAHARDHDLLRSSIQSELQVPHEGEMIKTIRAALPDDVVIYTEECPTDVATQYQDGSFTYAFSRGSHPSRHNPSSVNLVRFAFSDYKLFSIIRVDAPLGLNFEGVIDAFFNGEGIWLSGPLNDPDWFPTETRALIAKCYGILSAHPAAFRSLNPIPLVDTLAGDVYANFFPAENEQVWTFRNVGDADVDAPIISVPHIAGSRYYDAWNDQELTPRIMGDRAELALRIEGQGAGCLVLSKV